MRARTSIGDIWTFGASFFVWFFWHPKLSVRNIHRLQISVLLQKVDFRMVYQQLFGLSPGGGFTYFFVFIPTWAKFPFWLRFLEWLGSNHQLGITHTIHGTGIFFPTWKPIQNPQNEGKYTSLMDGVGKLSWSLHPTNRTVLLKCQVSLSSGHSLSAISLGLLGLSSGEYMWPLLGRSAPWRHQQTWSTWIFHVN